MKRICRDYVVDIFDAVGSIEHFTNNMEFSEFAQDDKTISAVIRKLEVMGEAAARIPDHVRRKFPEVPRKLMTGMRNKLIHEYFGADLQIV